MKILRDGQLLYELLEYGDIQEYHYDLEFVSLIDGDRYRGLYVTKEDVFEFRGTKDIKQIACQKQIYGIKNKTKFPLYHRDLVSVLLVSVVTHFKNESKFQELYMNDGIVLLEPIGNNYLHLHPLNIQNSFELVSVIEGLKDRQHPFHKMDVKDFVSFLEL